MQISRTLISKDSLRYKCRYKITGSYANHPHAHHLPAGQRVADITDPLTWAQQSNTACRSRQFMCPLPIFSSAQIGVAIRITIKSKI